MVLTLICVHPRPSAVNPFLPAARRYVGRMADPTPLNYEPQKDGPAARKHGPVLARRLRRGRHGRLRHLRHRRQGGRQMGNAVWLAFVVSMVAAMLTGLSYASLASRYPRAAGAAYVTQPRLPLRRSSPTSIGLSVTASGLTSMATSTNVFADTLQIDHRRAVDRASCSASWRFMTARELLGHPRVDVDQLGVHGGRSRRAVVHHGIGMPLLGHVNYLETPAVVDANGQAAGGGSAFRCCSPARCSRSSRSSASRTCSTSPRR